MFDAAESERDNQAVFVPNGHDVGNRADCHKVGIVGADAAHRVLLGNTRPLCLKRAEQLEDDADPRQILKGIGAVGAAGIDNGGGIRQLAVAFVVVGDDNVDAACAGVVDLGVCRDAGVDRDDEFCPLVNQLVERAFAHAVALAHSVGYVVADVGAERR